MLDQGLIPAAAFTEIQESTPGHPSWRLLFLLKEECPVCRMVAPVVESLARAFPGLRVLGLAENTPEEVSSLREAWPVSFAVVSQPEPYPASRALQLESLPSCLLVDPEGQVRWVCEGWKRKDFEELIQTLERTLPGRAPALPDELPDWRPG